MTKRSIASALAILLAATAAVAQERTRLPQGPAGTVTLPVTEYDRLVDRAAQPHTRPDPPPVAAVVGRADLRARIAGDTIRGTLRLEGEVFQRGLVRVPLVSSATLLDARADGRPLALLHEGDAHVAVLAGPAPFAVTLEWVAPVSGAPGRASIALPLAAAGSIAATVDLPGDPADVRVENGVVNRRQSAGGRTSVEMTLQPGRRAQLSWSVRETAPGTGPIEARTLADIRSLVTIGDADLRMVSLVEVTVVRGEPRTFEVRLPAGYELMTLTGSTIEASETKPGAVVLTVRDPAQRRHQFLIGLEQPHGPGSFKVDTSFPTLSGAQREAGETAIEGAGTIDVTATGDDGLRRMDVRETHPSLRSLSRQPLVAAFRYQRRPSETRVLTLDVKRFADAPVIAAAAEHAVATTLVTVEGRTLTEVQLWVRNRAQPFMKVTLPAGATMVSVEVAGETAKPVSGTDGTRVPLLRTGFRPDGPYPVSFVYLHAGEAFAKRGDTEMALPRFDVPVSVLEWELFLPDRYRLKPTAGNVIPARLVDGGAPAIGVGHGVGVGPGHGGGVGGGTSTLRAERGQIIGRVVDPTGAPIPGATITLIGSDGVRRTAVSDPSGFYTFDQVPSGRVVVTSDLPGFKSLRRAFTFDQRPRLVDFAMEVGALTETVTVTAETPVLDTKTSESGLTIRTEPQSVERRSPETTQAPSQNVLNLQRRIAGVLPVRVDIPRAGTSYRFVRPLVFEEETRVSFSYKRR